MRNLIQFFTKNHLLLLFLLLEAISLTLMYRQSYYQRAEMVNSSNATAGKVYSAYANARDYVHLKEVNEDLALENAILHSMDQRSFIELRKISLAVNDTLFKQKYNWFSAKVVNNSVHKRNNYLTLDRGSRFGVKPEMAVVSALGVVGIVKNVSPNFCSVMSVLHKDMRISAQLKNNNYYGSLTWDGKDYKMAELFDIPKHVQVKKGDTVITSYYSSIFPQGIMIGTVEEFKKEAADNFYKIRVRLSTNYKNLTQVYLIENLMKTEQDTLEALTETSNDK